MRALTLIAGLVKRLAKRPFPGREGETDDRESHSSRHSVIMFSSFLHFPFSKKN